MYENIRFIGDLLVMVLVAFPPFLYFYQYTYDKVRNLFLKLFLYALYWVGTALLSNLIPALAVLFLIHESRKAKKREAALNEEEIIVYERKRFNLDCSGQKWSFSIKKLLTITFLSVFIKIVVTYINVIVVAILQKYNIALEEQEVVSEFLKADTLRSAMFFIIIVAGAPIVEEFVFRFWIYDRILKPRITPYLAALFSNLLFMGAHFNVQGAVSFFLVGVINCILYDRSGYWAAVTNHFMFNFISIVFLIILKLYNIPIEA